MSKDIDVGMLNAIAAYDGPIKRCRKGAADGSKDLLTWSQRRAVGKSGVPTFPKREKKLLKKWRKERRRYRRRRRRALSLLTINREEN